jgi:DNA-binding NarL/FixJ family response regulator
VEEEICSAVHALGRGHMWYPQQVLERHAIFSRALLDRSHDRGGLSPRESEVIGLLQRRLSNKEIGSALGITERTVRFHLQNVFDKLGLRDRYGVSEWARTAVPAERGREIPEWKAA